MANPITHTYGHNDSETFSAVAHIILNTGLSMIGYSAFPNGAGGVYQQAVFRGADIPMEKIENMKFLIVERLKNGN